MVEIGGYLCKLCQVKKRTAFTLPLLLAWLLPLYSFNLLLSVVAHTASAQTPNYEETTALKLAKELQEDSLALLVKNNDILSRGRDAAQQRGEKTISRKTETELFRTFSDWTQLWGKHSAYFINQKPATKTEAILLTMPKLTIALYEASAVTRFLSLRYKISEFNNITEALMQLKLSLSNKGMEALSRASDIEGISRILSLSFMPSTLRQKRVPMKSYTTLGKMSSAVGNKMRSITKNMDIDSIQRQEVEKLFHPYLEEHLLLRLRLGYMIDENLRITMHDFLRVQYSLNHATNACVYMAFILHDRSWLDYSIELLKLEAKFCTIIINEKDNITR